MTAELDRQISGLDDLQRWGESLSAVMKAGQVFCLSGPLGVGKSALARIMITACCDYTGDIPSPSWSLVQPYHAWAGFEIWHIDLYRLNNPEAAFALGLYDAFHTACCLIEWPEKLGRYLPHNALWITLGFGVKEEERHIHLSGENSLIEAITTKVI